jgi:hypothetical protein
MELHHFHWLSMRFIHVSYFERFSNSKFSTQRKNYLKSGLLAIFPSTIDFTKTFSELDVQCPNEENQRAEKKTFSLHITLLLKHLRSPFPPQSHLPKDFCPACHLQKELRVPNKNQLFHYSKLL